MNQKIVAVDFDGVIHRYSKGWVDGSIYDVPIKGSKEQMRRLVEKGYKIIIFTTRLNPELGGDLKLERKKIDEWLSSNGFKENVHYHQITALKPKASVYIDDHAIRFTNWEDMIKSF